MNSFFLLHSDTYMFYMQVTYVFAHQVMGGTFTKHPSGNTFKNWALPKFNIVNKAVDLLQKGVALFRRFFFIIILL